MKKLFLLLLFCHRVEAAFEATSFRYLSGHEVMAKIASVLPDAFAKREDVLLCIIGDSKAVAAGIVIPSSGRSVYLEPSTAFLNWYVPCLSEAMKKDLENTAIGKNYQRHLGPLEEKVQALSQRNYPGKSPYQIPVTEFTKTEFEELVKFQIERLLGPDEVIEALGFVNTAQDIRDDMMSFILPDTTQSSKDLSVVLKELEIEILSRDEFLVY